MSDVDLFIKTLQQKAGKCIENASSQETLSDYYRGKAEAFEEVAFELKKGLHTFAPK